MKDARAQPTTGAEALLVHMKQQGIDWLLANAGTDFAPIIEGLARGRKAGLVMPEAVPISHETTAVGMAHGYYLVSGRPQAVMVHVNVGTANALMGVINASRDRVPMLFMSGRTPLTEEGELGSRDVPIHWGQEMFDQGGMLREVVKWDYELRGAGQAAAVVERALSIAMSEPRGPVYLSLPREVLAAPLPAGGRAPLRLRPASDPHADPAAIEEAARLLSQAKRPLAIAGGADTSAFGPLARLAERLAMPVAHFWPARSALSSSHPLHAGFDPAQRLAEADVVLVVDLLVPWLPMRHKLQKDAKVIQIGPDPAFARIPMRTFPADVLIAARTGAALEALAVAATPVPKARREQLAREIAAERVRRHAAAAVMPAGLSTAAWVAHCLEQVKGEDAIVLNELGADVSLLTHARGDSYFGHPIAAGLGWGVPASLGAKLAGGNRTVIAMVGDGSYMFANPVACHQTAAALGLPTLTIVMNNGVWNAVRRATRSVYPSGSAVTANDIPLANLTPSPAYDKVVEACGGLGIAVPRADMLPAALARGLSAVRAGQPAVLNVHTEIAN